MVMKQRRAGNFQMVTLCEVLCVLAATFSCGPRGLLLKKKKEKWGRKHSRCMKWTSQKCACGKASDRVRDVTCIVMIVCVGYCLQVMGDQNYRASNEVAARNAEGVPCFQRCCSAGQCLNECLAVLWSPILLAVLSCDSWHQHGDVLDRTAKTASVKHISSSKYNIVKTVPRSSKALMLLRISLIRRQTWRF